MQAPVTLRNITYVGCDLEGAESGSRELTADRRNHRSAFAMDTTLQEVSKDSTRE